MQKGGGGNFRLSPRHADPYRKSGRESDLSCTLSCCCTASKFAIDKEVIEVASKPDLEETVVD